VHQSINCFGFSFSLAATVYLRGKMRSERNRIRNIGYANDSGGGLVVRADLPPFALVSVFCFCCCCLGRLHEIIRSQCCVRNAFHDPRCTKFFSVGNSFFLPMLISSNRGPCFPLCYIGVLQSHCMREGIVSSMRRS